METFWFSLIDDLWDEKIPGRIFTAGQVQRVFFEHRDLIAAPASVTPHKFLKKLLENKILTRVEISPEKTRKKIDCPSYKPFIRYVRPGVNPYEVALALRNDSFFSHATAAHIHGLLTHAPDAIYVNKEQGAKPAPDGALTQASIDQAFSSKPRVSKYIFMFDGQRMMLLNGKHTNKYGVIETKDSEGTSVRLTSLERTLVDIAVRPAYAGGVENVLNIYSAAKDRVSVPKVVDVLKALGHVYPYHQAIGFYLQKAGLSQAMLAGLSALGLNFDFYLGNRLRSKAFDTDWRVYVPSALTSTAAEIG